MVNPLAPWTTTSAALQQNQVSAEGSGGGAAAVANNNKRGRDGEIKLKLKSEIGSSDTGDGSELLDQNPCILCEDCRIKATSSSHSGGGSSGGSGGSSSGSVEPGRGPGPQALPNWCNCSALPGKMRTPSKPPCHATASTQHSQSPPPTTHHYLPPTATPTTYHLPPPSDTALGQCMTERCNADLKSKGFDLGAHPVLSK